MERALTTLRVASISAALTAVSACASDPTGIAEPASQDRVRTSSFKVVRVSGCDYAGGAVLSAGKADSPILPLGGPCNVPGSSHR
jgi:hypothetical protein